MGKLSEEVSSRTAADGSLTTRLSSEEVVRDSADVSLNNAIVAEASLRGSADLSLTNRVAAEESLRGSADTSINGAISSEIAFRVSADSSLTSRVSTEESVRSSADTSLTSRISAEESSRSSADKSVLAAAKDKLFMARVGSGLAAYAAATNIPLDSVAGSLYRSSDFKFLEDVIDLNSGFGLWTGKSAFPDNLQVFINGIMLRPVFDAGKVKTFMNSETISFAGLQGDFVMYKNSTGPVGGIAFAFALKAGDEVQVRYNNG
jgi:hypothetical protein